MADFDPNRLLAAILDNSPALLSAKDGEGRYVVANEHFPSILGIPAENLLGKTDRDIFPASVAEELTRNDDEVRRRGEQLSFTEMIADQQGNAHWFLSRKFPVFSADGKLALVACIALDRSDERRMSDELALKGEALESSLSGLRSAVLARDEFLSVASHELRTPLTSLLLQAQSLQRLGARLEGETYPRERVDKLAAQTEKQVRRLARLVDDMLDVSRIQSGTLQLEITRFDLSELVEEVVERMAPQFESAGYARPALTIVRNVMTSGDRYRIEQVINNLLTNAIRYGEKRAVEVLLHDEDATALLCVRDHGLGIAASAKDQIFDRFARVSNAAAISGLGLGLFITRQIVQAHGGSVWVESELGSGSTFCVRLLKEMPGSLVSAK